ncbi:hypothetical protein MVEN_01585500 [Mycena venus]|uniref:Peptidase A1 domain-containing protein n=1 Tax=Mycena venus TaxID=2733690 RepID=A0A8H6XRZ2_9AGAR|nr:hypothetical protein MVEN_01585500 [Mycena venus]
MSPTLPSTDETLGWPKVQYLQFRLGTFALIRPFFLLHLQIQAAPTCGLYRPKIFSFNNTGVPISDGYVGGDANGTLGVATVELGGYSFGSQAFNNATVVSVSGFTDIGVDGLIGLSFDGKGVSPIMNTLSAINQDPNLGKPFLFNIFDQTPAKNNFIGVSLPRTDDPQSSATGSFSINKVDPAYAAAANAPSLPLFPGNNSIWSIILDSMSVDNVTISLPPVHCFWNPGWESGRNVGHRHTDRPVPPTAARRHLLQNPWRSQCDDTTRGNEVDHPMQHDVQPRFALWRSVFPNPSTRYLECSPRLKQQSGMRHPMGR